jgi:hypothetical protein
MNLILYLSAYLPVVFILYFLLSIVIIIRTNKKHSNNITLYGNGFLNKKNLYFHTLIIIYFVIIVIIGVLYLSNKYVNLPTNYFIFSGPALCVFLILGTSIIFIHLGENGVLVGRRFYYWNEIRSVEICDSDNLRTEVLLLKIQLQPDDSLVTGYLSKKNLNKLHDILERQHLNNNY